MRTTRQRSTRAGGAIATAAIIMTTLVAVTGAEAQIGPRADRPALDPSDVPIPSDFELILEDVRELDAFATRARNQIAFSEAEIFFEENATDGDLGIHFAIDGEDWTRVLILDPSFRTFFDARARGSARDNGVTGLFSESAEPPYDEVPREEFLEWFPAGEYVMLGTTTEGDLLFAIATLTHDLPAEPESTAPEEDEEIDASLPLVIEWEPVADPNPPASVIISYEVIVTRESGVEREVIIQLDSSHTSATVPPEFLEPGQEYKFEVIARETSGNQTITEVPFTTAD